MVDLPRQFPLPPRQDNTPSAKKADRRKPLYHRTFRAVAKAPGKLLQRVNQELYKRNAELAVRNKTLALLRKLDEISLAAIRVPEMAQQMSQAIATELGYDLATIVLVEAERSSVQWVALSSATPWIIQALKDIDREKLKLALGDTPALTRILEKPAVQYVDEPQAIYPEPVLKRLSQADQNAALEEIKYTALFPLRFGQQVLGLLTLSSSRTFQKASKYEHESVTGIVGLVSLAMYKAKIYEDLQSTTAQLEEANEQLKNLDKVKSEFLSIASHQLYTPLTALRGYLSMLQEGDFGKLLPKQAPVVDILQESANRLITLIRNLLDISRIEAGRLELKLESLDLVELSKQLVQDLMPNAIAKKLDLEFHSPAQPIPHVVADRERIRQVLLNIVDNAIKYTEQGHVDVRVQCQNEHVAFLVQDTGKGMTQSDIRKIFTKFMRVGGAERFHTEGTGLGLYVARQIVREHHGEVKAESAGLGQGSSFSLILPAEGSPQSLKTGELVSVEIKAAESGAQKDHPPAPA